MATEPKTQRPSPLDKLAPGIKIAAQASSEAKDVDLKFIAQMGVRHSVTWTRTANSNAEYYSSRKELFAKYGINIYGFGNFDVHNQEPMVLGGPDARKKIEEYKRHLQALGKAGIPYTTYAHMPNGIWSTEPEPTRGGAPARAYDVSKGGVGTWFENKYHLPKTNDRDYSVEEIWDNFAIFIREAARVAEDEGVMIGIHPADPPISPMGGVPRLFSTLDDYKRAFEIADSPNIGICLCVGCWLEGGAEIWGVDVFEAIRYFCQEKRLFKVHFRNVDQPLPHFVETFIDDGYTDMYDVMRALVDNGFRGVAIPDHIPRMADDPRLGTAFTIGYMRALLNRAEADAKAQAK